MKERFLNRLDELEVRLGELIPHTKTCVGLNSFHIGLMKLECGFLRAAIAKATDDDIAYIGGRLQYLEKYFSTINFANMNYQVSQHGDDDTTANKKSLEQLKGRVECLSRLENLKSKLRQIPTNVETCYGKNEVCIEIIVRQIDGLYNLLLIANDERVNYLASLVKILENYYDNLIAAQKVSVSTELSNPAPNLGYPTSTVNINVNCQNLGKVEYAVSAEEVSTVGHYEDGIRYGKYDELLVYQDDASENDQPVLTCGIREKWYELYVVMPDNRIEIFDIDTSCVDTLDHTYDPHTLLEYCNRMGVWIDTNSLDMIIGRWTNNTLELVPDMDS